MHGTNIEYTCIIIITVQSSKSHQLNYRGTGCLLHASNKNETDNKLYAISRTLLLGLILS